MSEEEALIATVLAAPGDETARLVFADWLEDRADPRAGCLRLAARLRANYGPRHSDYSKPFWKTLGEGIEPACWAEEARRLANEVDEQVGDGGKTAVLIALALVEATLLFPNDWNGNDAYAFRNAAAQAVEAIDRLAVQPRSPEEVLRCLRTASQGDGEIAEAMLSAFRQGGRDGIITIRPVYSEGRRERARVIVQEGLRFPLSGLDQKEERELHSVVVLVSLRPLQAEAVRQILTVYSRGRAASLLCLCPGFDARGAELFRIAARGDGRLFTCAAAGAHWRDHYEDAAAATGAGIIRMDEEGPVEITPERFGQADLIRVEAGQLVIDLPADELDSAHRDRLLELIDETVGEEREWHAFRLAQLTGGVVSVEVAADTLPEVEHLYELSCRTLHSGRATIAEGYVPGGGVAYLRAASARLEGPATRALRWALEEPARTLGAGAGMDVRDTLASLRANEDLGLDVVRNGLPPWHTAGPIDSTRVVRTVIERAIASPAPTLTARGGNGAF